MRLNRPLIMFGLMAVVIAALVIFNRGAANCQTEPPPLPVYPGSVPLGEYPVVQTETHQIIQYEYSADAGPGALQAFFSENATCNNSDNAFICSVALDGGNSYTATIPNRPETSVSYTLQLNWDRCGIGWDAIDGFQ